MKIKKITFKDYVYKDKCLKEDNDISILFYEIDIIKKID